VSIECNEYLVARKEKEQKYVYKLRYVLTLRLYIRNTRRTP